MSWIDGFELDSIMEKASIVDKLPIWIEELVQAQNQLHGIRGTGMAKKTIQHVEEDMAKMKRKVDG